MQISEVGDSLEQSTMFIKLTESSSEELSSFPENTVSKEGESIQEIITIFDKQEFQRSLMYVVKCASQQKHNSSEVSKILKMGIDIIDNDMSIIKGNQNSKSQTSFLKDYPFQQSNNSILAHNFLVQLQEIHSHFLSQSVQLKQLKTTKQKMEKQKNEEIDKMKKKIDQLKLSNQQITKKYINYKQQAIELKQKLDRCIVKLNSKIQSLN